MKDTFWIAYLPEELGRDNVKLHDVKRTDLKEFDVPIVIKIDSVPNVTNKPTQGTESGIKREILLPLSTCTVSISLSCEQLVSIIVNEKYYFSKD